MTRTKKIITIVAAVIVVALIAAIGFASVRSGVAGQIITADAAWEGDGEGTSDNPYRIGSRAQMEKFRDIVNGSNGESSNKYACAVLTANIDLGGNDVNQWTPIGNDKSNRSYKGTFDGNGHTISGLYIDDVELTYAGLFGYTAADCCIQNLTVEGSINCYSGAGIAFKLVGRREVFAPGEYTSTVCCRNCTNKVNVTGIKYAAGIVAENSGTIIDCVNEGNMSAQFTGGIASCDEDGVRYNKTVIKNCVNYGDLTCTKNNDNPDYCSVGGIMGHRNFNTITGCVNNGNITATFICHDSRAGGIAGSDMGTITDCVNNGSISITDGTSEYNDEIGGIVGQYFWNSAYSTYERCEPLITNCSNHGLVSVSGYSTNYIGGIVGVNNSGDTIQIVNCFNDGTISGTNYAGGISGYDVNAEIEKCYNVGPVESSDDSNKGEIKGGGDATITNCHYLASTTDATTGALAKADFADKSYFVDWSFSEDWTMYQEAGGFTRPYLVKTWAVKYYGKDAEATDYAQALTLLGSNDNLNVILFNSSSFESSYYNAHFAPESGVSQDGWATEYKAEKTYNFGVVFTGSDTTALYPHYSVNAPTSATATGYEADADSVSHNIYVTFTHDLGDDAVYAYQWYKQKGGVYLPIYGATQSTFGVKNEADSGNYKLAYEIKCDGHDEYQSYRSAVKDIVVNITNGADPDTIPEGKTATLGQTLADVDLSGGWAWSDGTLNLNKIGTFLYAATYNDNVYYVDVTVNHDAWTGNGTGTQADPYIITNKAQLEFFRDIVNGKFGATKNLGAYAKLGANIDLEGSNVDQWTPIADSSSDKYTGTFDGNGYTISGLYINDTTMDYAGLFGYSGSGSTIKDLTVAGTIICNNGAGIVRENNGNILRCVNKADVDAQQETGGIAVGSNGNITECVNAGTVYARTKGVNFANGGIAARNMGEIIGCVNNGVVKAFSTMGRNSYTGGIVGVNRKIVSYCVNNGMVIGYFGSGEWGSSVNYFGGITAYQYNKDNSEPVVTTRYCVNNGEVNYEGDDAVSFSAGIVGMNLNNGTTVENCYNAGIVKTSGVYPSAVAGITRFNSDDAENCVVRNCYNIGEIMIGNNAGEPITNFTGLAENCYYLADQTGEANANIRALSEADFADAANFSTWSFGNVWAMYQGSDGLMRPYLVKDTVKYYDKDNNGTAYMQPTSLLCVDNALTAVLYGPASFDTDYSTLYNRGADYSHVGWATEHKGQKVYDFGEEYNGAKSMNLYPAYDLAEGPTAGEITVEGGSTWTFDGNVHTLSITVTYGSTINYQWYKSNAATGEYELIEGATGATYGVTYVAESAMYKVVYSTESDGYVYSYEKTIWIGIKKADPTAPIGLKATYGDTLANVDLPEGWAWVDDTTSVGTVGERTFKANYAETDNYNAASNVDVTVTVYYAVWNGEGTSDNPYRIGSRAQMEKFRDIVNGSNGESRNISACAVLTADFDLEGDADNQWTPIADSSSDKYTGTFDGNGHTISGLYINDVSAVNVGLFGYTGSGSVIKDLTVAGKIICCNGAVFVKENNGSILRCTNNADIDAQEEVGGIAQQNNGNITDCVNAGAVYSRFAISSCSSGGIASRNAGTITGCVNNGVIKLFSVYGKPSSTGGITGTNNKIVSYCVNNGTVAIVYGEYGGASNYVGGVVGNQSQEVVTEIKTTYCVNNGLVTYEGDNGNCFSGGVVGNIYHGSTVENCYNVGKVQVPASGRGYGVVYHSSNDNTIINCYNIGQVNGGLTGQITWESGAKNCYYLANQTGEMTNGQKALSEADFADASNFSNWDFSDVWTMYQEENGFMRPYLVKARVNYYSKDNAATGYSQLCTLWGVDDVLSELHEPADFGADYENLYSVAGATHDGWTTEIGGEKVYDFGGTYTGKDALTLYPHYTINAPTSVTTEGYEAEYDGASHNISITVTHELAGATITYQWYLREALNPAFALITGATGSTYSVKNGGDSGMYKVTYRVSLPGHGEYKAYEAEENAIYVNITAGEDPTTFPEQMTATIGQTLADVDLPDGWAWIDTTTALNTIGSFWFEAKYNNDDAFVYQANVIVNHGAWTGRGTGTAADPYIIENKEQLEFFRDIVNGKFGATKNNKACAKLVANINLAGSNNDQWSPFVLYTGVFDGNGYTIKGVYINKPSSDSAFFMEIALGGIKNLTLEGYVACFDGGGFVETVREGVVISNCHNKVTVIGDKTNNPYNLAVGARTGGIAAYNYGTIEDCTNNADVQSFRPGGIVGENYGTIRRCENNYSLTVVSYNGGGGIAGAMQGAAVIEYCINRGDLFDSTKTFSCLGGICGTAKESGEDFPIIRYCVNEGKISGQTSNGGILGIAKHNYIVIRDCYNLAEVVGTSYCAGICGVGGAVYNSYNMGSYPGTTQGHNFGPICGDSTRIYNCYYLDDQTGEMTNGQKALSLADFADAANFVDWDFEKVWTIKDGRPQLYRDFVIYCDKNGEVTSYAQPRTILGCDDILPNTTLKNADSFGADYATLYGANGPSHDGWAKEFGGTKSYSFGAIYSASKTVYLYPYYSSIDVPTVTAEGYTGTYDSAAHDLTATVEHDLGDDATYTYQWYKLDGSEYEAIDGATGSAYSVTEIADSGTYKVVVTLHFAGYTVDAEEEDIIVTISKIVPTYDVPADLTATIGDTLDSVALPDGWTWNEPEKVLNKLGLEVCVATFTPEDTAHYNVVEIDLTVGVYHTAWDGEGTGTEADPYVITTKAELEHFRDIVNGYYVETKNEYANAVLANDIDLNGSDSDQWSPIGDEGIDSSNAFSGNFDGAGHTISGLYINTDNDDYTYKGLFGDTYRAMIKNLTVDGSVTCNRGGGIVGSLSGSMIINCVSNVNVTARDFGGGLVSYTVIAAGKAGLTWRYPQIIDCVNNGNVSGFYRAGGMTSYNAGHIIGCVNNGNILIDRNQDETYQSCYAGGIAGENSEYIAYCVNNGTVTVSLINPLHSNDVWGRAGGIAAMNWSENNRDEQKIQYCINNGEVKCDCTNLARNSAGGIVAYDNCVVENCYNTAKVTGTSTVGGICGKSSDDAEDAGWITNCYNLGIVVKANNGIGAQIMDTGNAIVTGCHYLADTTDDATGALAQADFADSAKFVGWDFDKVWTMYQEENDFSRPHLFGGDVRYYDKNYWSTAYAQPKTILGVDGILPDEVTLYDVADFGADYLTLYRRNGYVHYGWTTQQNGEKVYDFGAVYTGTADLEIYPVYVAIPTGLEAAYGQTLADVSLPDGWTWVDNTLSVGDIGNNYFQASYNSVRTDVKVTVSKGDPTYDVPADLTATIDDTLDSVVLPDGWTWNEPEKVLNKVGPEVCVATFTPEDTDHYNVVEIDLTVSVYHTEWDGEGTGTEADPYVITTKAELEYFRDIVNGFCVQTQNVYAHAILANDINLNGSESDQWIPIGEEFVSPNVFKGVFNGNDKTISGLYINNDKTWMGLFGTIDGGLVNNLTVEGTVTANWGAGIAGFIIGGGRIVDCVNKANVTGKYAAGIVMANNTTDNASGIVLNCVNEGTMTATQMAGGIAVSNDGIITDCVNKGQIQILNDATEDTTICVGGIAAHNTRTISDCINNGKVFVSLEYPTPNVSINVNAGGIAGRNFDSVTYCVNNVKVEVQVNWGGRNEYAYAGGIVGSQRYQSDNERYRYEVRYCANDGDVSNYYGYTSNNVRHDYTGGIVGRFDYGVIADCYSTGHIHGGTCCGGICCTTDGSTEGTIINCYNAGEYEKGTLTAGNPIVANGNPTVISCYYRLPSQATSEDPNAYYNEDFAVQSNFEGWDFGKVWTIYTRYSTARPYLVREGIVYYDKNGEATNYGQARVILDLNDTLPAVNLFDIASFGDDYNALYGIPGYVLDGWATTAGGEKVYDFGDEYAAAEGIVLYPHYSLVTYTITYENWPAVDEGVTNDNPTSYTVEDGDIVLVAPNREGYEFIGWVIGDEDPVEDYTIISGTTGDITLTMEWLMMIDDPYGFAAPTVTALNGYVGAYDGKAHVISATFEHELDVTYTYRWKKDGAIIEGATSATLSVKDVADSGVYTLLHTASFNGRTREEAEAGPIVVYIGQKSVRLDIEDKTSVEGYVTDATATVKGAVEGERIDVIVTYRKGTTVLTEKPTRPGKYIAVATIDEANYVAEPVEAAFVINVAEIDPNNVENTTGKDITVSSPDGFGEDTTLIVDIPDADEKKEIKSKIGEDKNVVEVYHIDMKEDGKDVELTDPVKVRLPIPDDLKNKGFDVYNVNGDHVEKVKYKIDGDFIEFETDTLGNFAFVERTEVNKDGEDGGNVVTQKISSLIDKIGLDVFIYILIGAVFLDIILLIALAVAILRRL